MSSLRILTSWPIRRKLLLLLVVIFLPASGIIVAAGLDHRTHEFMEADKNALLLVQSLAAQQEQIAIGTEQMLSTLAQLPEVQRLDTEACNELFRELLNRHPFYSQISAATPEGNIFAISPLNESGSVNLSDRKHIKDVIRTLDFSAGEYVIGRVTNVPSINYSYPVLDANKNLIAIVIAGFKLDEYARFITKANLPESYAIAITDHNGMRLFRLPENAATLPGKPIPGDSFEKISGHVEQGTFENIGEDGIDRIYAFNQVRLREDSPPYMYMFAGIAKDKIAHKANIEMMSGLLFLGITAAIGISLAWSFGNVAFVRPISRLVASAQQLGGGEMGTRTDIPHTPDELGQLAKSFDDMASLLEKRGIERKNAEEALRQSEEFIRTLLDNIPERVFAKDEKGRYTLLNKTCSDFWCLPCDAILGKTDWDLFEKNQATIFAASDQVVLETGKPYSTEVSVKVGDERDVVLSISKAPLRDSMGRTIGLVGVSRDITETRRNEKALQESEKQLKFLSSELLKAQENERKLIANEIHDSVGQSLHVIKAGIESIIDNGGEGGKDTAGLKDLKRIAEFAIEEVRNIYMDLRPSLLDDLGVLAAMNWFLREFRRTYPGIAVEEKIAVQEEEVPQPLKIIIFRVLQGTMDNIAQHSMATCARVSLQKTDAAVDLNIDDNGLGFDMQAIPFIERGALGLATMQERVESSGGVFTIRSGKGTGTTLRARWACT